MASSHPPTSFLAATFPASLASLTALSSSDFVVGVFFSLVISLLSFSCLGGPFWTRTRDLSLIRINDTTQNIPLSIGKPGDHINAWYKEQLLKGITKSTADAHLGRIKALLNAYPTPDILGIQDYLSDKQKAGYLSGTIANYVKSFRSFFGYLYINGLYNLDYQRLKIPKIKYRERRVPTDEEVSKLFQELDNDEDRVALLLLVDCGLRVTELATIKLKNINLVGCEHFNKR